MKSLLTPFAFLAAIVFAAVMWLYSFGMVATKGGAGSLDAFFGVVVLAFPILLPILGFLCIREQPRSWSYKLALFPAFIVSLAPAAILGCVLLVCFLIPPHGCVYTSGTRKISVGMTKAQVVHKIGLPERTSRDGQPETMTYILECPWHDDRIFCVKLADGKVASCGVRDQ